ncbi:hypothetical protein [Halosimplex amylolyticum]|uniref:hypothetical protein n=1 Tax=Halosimplex amylolyticum TaxID=3396616 RepID=UPI003F552910
MTISSPGQPAGRETAVEPALDDLARKQDELFARLEAGFASRREILLWTHDVSVRTLGQVPDEWFAQLFSTRYTVTALLADSDRRGEISESVESDERAATERAILADDTLVESCRQGMRLLAEQAAEYTEAETPVDASAQSYLAMRPAVDDLAATQRDALKRVLGYAEPINSRADVRDWARRVIRATKGADEGFTREMLWTPHWLNAVRGDPRSATLHLLLADDMLAPMNAALRKTATAATEQADEDRTSHGAFET